MRASRIRRVVCIALLFVEVGTSLSFLSGPKTTTLRSQQRIASSAATELKRRDVLQHWSSVLINSGSIIAGGIVISPAANANAEELVAEGEQRMVFRQKPTAPIGALLPAIQQRMLLEAALEVVKKQSSTEDLKPKLASILLPLGDDNGASDKRSTNIQNNNNAGLLKQYNPAKVLRGDLARATMNLYTTNLNYNAILGTEQPRDAYAVTDPNWKKSYIRTNDGLPNIQKVIGADLDLRFLYRNQVQLKIDDAVAEFYYQCDSGNADYTELQSLLQEAAQAFDLWLDRIRFGDVRDALEAAMSGETTQVQATWAAGFTPPTTTQ